MARTYDLLVRARGETRDAEVALRRLQRSVRDTGTSMKHVGESMTRGISIPLGLIGVASIKASLDFNRNLSLIQTQAHASAKEVDSVRQGVLAMAGTMGVTQGPKQLAEAMYHIESTGLRGAKALSALKESAQLATVGNAKLDDTTYALSATIASGIGGFHGFAQAAAILNATVGAGDMRMQDLVASLSTGVLPVAAKAGVSLQQLGAALAVMTDAGVPAVDAATRLRMTISLLAAPSLTAQKQLDKIKISATELGHAMHKGGPIAALKLFRDHLDAFSKDPVVQQGLITRAFGGGRSSGAITQLLGSLDTLDYGLRAKTKAVAAGMNKFASDITQSQKNESVQLQEDWANIQKAGIQLGDALAPAVHQIAGEAAHLADEFSGLSPHTRTMIADLGMIAIAAGPVTYVMGSLIKVVGGARTTVKLFADSAVAARSGMSMFAQGFGDAQVAGSAFTGAMGSLGGAARSAGAGMVALATGVEAAEVSAGAASLAFGGLVAVVAVGAFIAGAFALRQMSNSSSSLEVNAKQAADAVSNLRRASEALATNNISAKEAEIQLIVARRQAAAATATKNKAEQDYTKKSPQYRDAALASAQADLQVARAANDVRTSRKQQTDGLKSSISAAKENIDVIKHQTEVQANLRNAINAATKDQARNKGGINDTSKMTAEWIKRLRSELQKSEAVSRNASAALRATAADLRNMGPAAQAASAKVETLRTSLKKLPPQTIAQVEVQVQGQLGLTSLIGSYEHLQALIGATANAGSGPGRKGGVGGTPKKSNHHRYDSKKKKSFTSATNTTFSAFIPINAFGDILNSSNISAAGLSAYQTLTSGSAYSTTTAKDGTQTVTPNQHVIDFLTWRKTQDEKRIKELTKDRAKLLKRLPGLRAARSRASVALRLATAKGRAAAQDKLNKAIDAVKTVEGKIDDDEREILDLGGQIASDTAALTPPDVTDANASVAADAKSAADAQAAQDTHDAEDLRRMALGLPSLEDESQLAAVNAIRIAAGKAPVASLSDITSASDTTDSSSGSSSSGGGSAATTLVQNFNFTDKDYDPFVVSRSAAWGARTAGLVTP